MAYETVGKKVGTIGDVVYYVRNGKQCMRRKPKHQKNPNTEKQQASRGRFVQVSQLAAMLLPVVKVGLHNAARRSKVPEYNMFAKVNSKAVGSDGIDYSRILVGKGYDTKPVKFGRPEITKRGKLQVPFEPRPAGEDENGHEVVFVAALCPDKKASRLSEPVSCESGIAVLQVPASWVKHKLHLYGFVRVKGLKTSDSVYIPLEQEL